MMAPFARRARADELRAGRRAWLVGLATALAGGAGRAFADAPAAPPASAAASPPAAARPASFPSIHDRMTEFWPVYDATQGLAADQRGQRLWRDYFQIEAPLYLRAGLHDPAADRVTRWLARFDPMA